MRESKNGMDMVSVIKEVTFYQKPLKRTPDADEYKIRLEYLHPQYERGSHLLELP